MYTLCVCVYHKVCESVSRSVMFDSEISWIVGYQALCLQNSPGKNIGVGCHSSPGDLP